MDVETRIRCCTQNLRPTIVRYSDLPQDNRPMLYGYEMYRGKPFPQLDKMYYHDMTRHLHYSPSLYSSLFLFCPRDRVEPFHVPTLVKTRPIHETNMGSSILMNLNAARHFEPLFTLENNDVPFHSKSNKLVWRGADTGFGFGNNLPFRECSREHLVRTFGESTNSNIDIGLSECGSNKVSTTDLASFIKPKMTISEMLRHKFLLSIEGNDVATNLKWILYSNSVPFCPPFTMQSWILEDNLIPWQHFIPIRADFLDMEDKLEWCIHHPSRCRSIARQGKEYMSQFLDVRKENAVIHGVLSEYAKQVRVVTS